MIEKIHRWTCDSNDCRKEFNLTRYGLPNGWMWLRKDGEIQHACPDCVLAHKADGWGVAKSDHTQLTNIPGQFIR